jgi:hypothetical protein
MITEIRPAFQMPPQQVFDGVEGGNSGMRGMRRPSMCSREDLAAVRASHWCAGISNPDFLSPKN